MEIKRLTDENKEYAVLFEKVRTPAMKPDKLKRFLEDSNTVCYFAVDKQMVIGLAWGYALKRFDNNDMLYIHSVDVVKEYRNKGVGKALIEAFISYQKEHQMRNTFLITDEGNIPANKLYQKFSHELETNKNLYIFKWKEGKYDWV